MPPPAGREVFPVLQNGLLARLRVTINAIDTVRHHPHKGPSRSPSRTGQRQGGLVRIYLTTVSFFQNAPEAKAVDLPIP